VPGWDSQNNCTEEEIHFAVKSFSPPIHLIDVLSGDTQDKGNKIMKTHIFAKFFVAVTAILLISAFTDAQTCPGSPGCLDSTFGIGGMVITQPPLADDPLYNSAMDMVFQNDGKIVILARAKDSLSTFQTVLVRYTANGQLDATFASGGFLYIPAEAYAATFARRLIKQNIGGQERFVVASGDKCSGVPCIRVLRYTTDGTLDPSFGTGGVSTVPSGGSFVTAAAVQADQKILLGCPQYSLIRLNANGSPDSSFGPHGIATYNDWRMLVSTIVALPSGKILTAGAYLSANSGDLYVAQFTSNGRSDGSFASQGKRVIDFAGMDDAARALAVDSAGNIIVAGYANIGGPMSSSQGWDAVIVRLTSNGTLDKKFGTNGRTAFLNIGGGEDSFQSVAIQSGGKIVAAGKGTLPGNSSDILVARYNANGTLDSTFHGNGWNLTDIYGSDDFGRAGLIQIDPTCSCSKLVVAATALTGTASLFPHYIVALRYSL
jgi:uncharacterized delta-60 repeat protein